MAGRDLKLTNLDKVLFPGRDGEPPVTKRELVRHYATIAPTLLPYLAGRPVNLHRYPDGVDRPGFWQQELPAGAPEWVTRWHDPEAGPDDAECRVVADSVADAGVAGQPRRGRAARVDGAPARGRGGRPGR